MKTIIELYREGRDAWQAKVAAEALAEQRRREANAGAWAELAASAREALGPLWDHCDFGQEDAPLIFKEDTSSWRFRVDPFADPDDKDFRRLPFACDFQRQSQDGRLVWVLTQIALVNERCLISETFDSLAAAVFEVARRRGLNPEAPAEAAPGSVDEMPF